MEEVSKTIFDSSRCPLTLYIAAPLLHLATALKCKAMPFESQDVMPCNYFNVRGIKGKIFQNRRNRTEFEGLGRGLLICTYLSYHDPRASDPRSTLYSECAESKKFHAVTPRGGESFFPKIQSHGESLYRVTSHLDSYVVLH